MTTMTQTMNAACTARKNDVVACFGGRTIGVVVADHGKHCNGRRVLEVLTADGRSAMPFADECAMVRAYRRTDISDDTAQRFAIHAAAR